MTEHKDIIVTWPKTRALASYLSELRAADAAGWVINYRVSRLPEPLPERCYMIHDGYIRGWTTVLSQGWREDVRDWPPGYYITRSPVWHECLAPLRPMTGFRGWRWIDRVHA